MRYEVTFASVGPCPQVGWATPSFHSQPGVPCSDGVGDLADSWAIDGARCVLWHNGRLPSHATHNSVPRWAAGDVVGVAADLDAGQLWFGLNGEWSLYFDVHGARVQGAAAQGAAGAAGAGDPGGMLRLALCATGPGIYPALSARDALFSICCGGPDGAGFRYPPPPALAAGARPWTHLAPVATGWPGGGSTGRLSLLRGVGSPSAPPPPPLRRGDLVRVRPGLLSPMYGWGNLSPGSVGTILELEAGGDCTVDFPEHAAWHGNLADLEGVRGGAPAGEDELPAGTLVRVTANSPDSVWRGLTPNPEPRTPNTEPRTLNPEPPASNHELRTLHSEPLTSNPNP